MMEFNSFGKSLIFFGAALIVVGAIFMLAGKVHWFSRLPGDILIQKKNFTLFFPITTSILVSVILSLIFYLLSRK